MTFNKVVLVAGSWQYDCGEFAKQMGTQDVDIQHLPSGKPVKPLKECAEHIKSVGPTVVVWFRSIGYSTCDPAQPEKDFMKGLQQCPSVTHVIIVAYDDEKRTTSPQDSEDYEGRWVN